MIYDLWDVESGNLIETFETEREALVAVCELLAVNTPDYADALSLGFEDGDYQGPIAQGRELVERARAAVVEPPLA